ncbi:MAG: hypothetical protein Q8Q08_10280 [Candidatus Omnitrophota bacterium]|nr:hypothetical protein [Candidatus Omnitrophota bacterium]MDZ4241234.1 hypothetical protein [Candidatus Omnitrophota bacterium]
MKRTFVYLIAALVIAAGCASSVWAEEDGQWSLGVNAGRYAAVKGDVAKFRAHHWMKDGYVGGIEHLSFDEKVGTADFSFEGYTIPEENDNEAIIILKKGEEGFIKTEYKSFRKYYDTTGGVYNRFVSGSRDLTNQDLKMDMAHFMLELGLGTEAHPDLNLMYERHTKKGKKSRLTWTSVTEGATTKSIGPAWQQVDETADIVTLKGTKEVAGITLKGEQKAEWVESRNVREEKSLDDTGALSTNTKIRVQEQKPEARVLASTLRGEKWIIDDKTFAAIGYRFAHVNNTEYEWLREYDQNYSPTSYGSYPEQKLPSDAENRMNEHIWTGHFQNNLTPDLSFISKLKVAAQEREGSSTYPNDKTPSTPDGIVNTTEVSNVENKVNRIGENIALRYTGFSHATLYADAEMEQTRNWISEFRDSIAGQSAVNASDQFFRETITNINKTVLTAGARIIPSKTISMTAHVRHKDEMNDYDDLIESPITTSAKSAFLDALQLKGDEVATKFTWKPAKWYQNSFRYQLMNNKYYPRVENEGNTENLMRSHTYTYDITVQPINPLLMTVAFSHQQYFTKTTAGSASSTAVPAFNSGVNSWLFSTSYMASESISLINTILYSRADNYNDFSGTGLPLGADFKQYDMTTSLEWTPKKGMKVKPTYEYASYKANPLVEVGDYSAHIVWMDVGFDW